MSAPPRLKSSLFAALGLRPAHAQHTEREEALLVKYAAGRRLLAEIGVAEGVSAGALKEAAGSDATLYLIDPYESGRIPGLNFQKFVAHRLVGRKPGARVVWVESYSHDAVRDWKDGLDFVFFDGDHDYEACLRDWRDWSGLIARGGIAAFHDARVFDGGWTGPDWGPVRVVAQIAGSDWRKVGEADSLVIFQRS
jgi:hypothetical protein